MPRYNTGTPSNLVCNELMFPEFPDLLFGTTNEGINYFDATAYLQQHAPSLHIEDFFTNLASPIYAVVSTYEINHIQVHLINKEQHHLIESNLVYLFIAFVEPSFWAYMFDRIHEMFTAGFCVSDTYLVSVAKIRLTPEAIQSMFQDEQS